MHDILVNWFNGVSGQAEPMMIPSRNTLQEVLRTKNITTKDWMVSINDNDIPFDSWRNVTLNNGDMIKTYKNSKNAI